jgi:hypothetical protein
VRRVIDINPVSRNRIFFLLLLGACSWSAVLAFQLRSVDVVPTNGTSVDAQAGKLLTLSFRVTNTAAFAKKFESIFNAPAGWRRLAKDLPFTLDAGASDIKLLSVSIPAETPAGEYTVRYGIRDAANPDSGADAVVAIRIAAVKDQAVKLVDVPRLVIAGERYAVIFLLTNKGNVSTPVRLSALSSNRFPTNIDSTTIHLKAGESRTVRITVQTDAEIPGRVQDIIDFAAELDPSTIAHGSSYIDVLPRVTGEEDRYVTFPLMATARFVGQQEKTGGQVEIAGVGSLAALHGGTLDLMLRTPETQSTSVLGQRDEYRIGYSMDRSGRILSQYSLFAGDRDFSLSPLTEFNRYAFGAGANARVSDFSFGGFYNKVRFGAPDQREWAGFFAYHAGESAALSVNYLGKQDQNASDILSLRALVRPFNAHEFDLEYAASETGDQSDKAYSARWSARTTWLSSEVQYLHAGSGYTGYYRDVDFKNLSINLLPLRDLRLEVYYRDEDRNLKRDTSQYVAPHNRYVLVGAGYSSILSVYYRENVQDDLLPVSRYRRGDKTWQLRLSQSLSGIMLVGNVDYGTTFDDIAGNNSPYERFGIVANVQPFSGHTYGVSAEYTRQNDPSTLLPAEILSGSVNASVMVGSRTLISAALYATKTQGPYTQTYSLFDASIQHRFAGGQTLSIRGRQNIFTPSDEGKEIAYLAELSIPIGVPIARRMTTGQLTGRVVDAEKGSGISGVLVLAGGATALTDRDGVYRFASLKPDKYYVQVDLAIVGLDRIALQSLPHEVNVLGGQETRFDISLSRSISVSGVVLLYGMKEQLIADTAQPQVFEQGGHANVILELSNGDEVNRRVTDSRGRFSFSGIRPATWTLRIVEGNLPQNTYFEKDSFVIEAAPGSSMEYTFKALPRKRRIQILQQGKTLEAPPLKTKKPETVPSKTEKH